MTIVHLLVTFALVGLLLFRLVLDSKGKANTRLLAVALIVGVACHGLQSSLFFISSDSLGNSLRLVTQTLYVLFFLLVALHFTMRHLPVVGYWLPQGLIFLALSFTGTLIVLDSSLDTAAYLELRRTLLFLSATLAFVTMARSSEMLDSQPVFWIPTLIVAMGFGTATAGKLASTLLHFSGNGFAGLLTAISSSLGAVATLLLLIFLGANISWFRDTIRPRSA